MAQIAKNFNAFENPLAFPLNEFHSALLEEIEVTKLSVWNSAILLSNGHKVGQQGSAYQYAFLIDTVLNPPDDAPAGFMVTGKAPAEATVVSVKGLRIDIGVETDLGNFVPTAQLQADPGAVHCEASP